jgi:hypothetical protein
LTTIQALRDIAIRLIAENPIQVSIHRVEYVDDGAGGRIKQESDLPAFVGRVVPSRQGQGQNYQNEAGGLLVSDWLLIAPWDADLRAGSGITDSFATGSHTYRVTRVMPRGYHGELYAIHAILEEVG